MATPAGPLRGRPTTAGRARRHREILDAAISEFLHNGFGGASMDAIALAAGATKRTLYTHYGDKAGLYGAAVEQQHTYVEEFRGEQVTLESAAIVVVGSVFSDASIGLHRLVLAEAHRFPEIATSFYSRGPEQAMEFLAEHLPEGLTAARRRELSVWLFSLLLGEPHRRRLLGLETEPSDQWVKRHAVAALQMLRINR
ncbi:TetR/AcrR family transcriptional regulator [Leucobacter sp. 1207-22]|uniref:TetR/AcrR family transcriptional regulator n=1 Tax=Leucobacter sp. 1207-22 TaxID=2604456 RepID=UPI00406452D8